MRQGDDGCGCAHGASLALTLETDVAERFASGQAVEVAGDEGPAAVAHLGGPGGVVWRHDDVVELLEREPRRPGIWIVLRRLDVPDVDDSAPDPARGPLFAKRALEV